MAQCANEQLGCDARRALFGAAGFGAPADAWMTKECVAVLLTRSPEALELQLGRTVDLLRGEFEAGELLPSAGVDPAGPKRFFAARVRRHSERLDTWADGVAHSAQARCPPVAHQRPSGSRR